tara:strand:+ start:127 stop:285 length:159 start_codon:yes stop_codon:yes gene_type:complete
MIRLSLIVAIVLFSILFYFSYKAPVLTSVPVEKAVDMGIWSESNKGNSLAEK